MRIEHARLIHYHLPLRQQWHSNRGTLNDRSGWIVELVSDNDTRGYGDCAPLPAAGTETPQQAYQQLGMRMATLTHQSPMQWLDTPTIGPQYPAACCALETALLDLVSQQRGLSLANFLNADAPTAIAVNANIGVLDGQSALKAQTASQQGFSTFKLKVGLTTVDQELAWLTELANQLPSTSRLRLDANGAWDYAGAERFIREIESLPVESLEEPLHQPALDKLAKLQRLSRCSLALDESLTQTNQQALMTQAPVRRIIIKPMVQGGPRASLALARQAMDAGLEVVVTSSLESAIGIYAGAHLAAAISTDRPAMAHGLATSDWFSANIAVPPTIAHGQLLLSQKPGLGIKPTPDACGTDTDVQHTV